MNVVITGASGGLGAALTKLLLKRGNTVFAMAYPACEREIWGEWAQDPKLIPLFADLQDPEQIRNAVAAIVNQAGQIDAVLNVAGILVKREDPITENTYEDIERTFRVNTFAPIYINNLLLPAMPNTASSVLLNICSEIRRIDDVGDWFPLYCLSKTALTQYVFSMLATLKKQNSQVRVLAVHPGRMKTAMGGSNSEITPEESAEGILRLLQEEKMPSCPYIDYMGHPMLA